MKNTLRFLVAALIIGIPAMMQAQGNSNPAASSNAAVATLMAQIRQSPAAQRQAMVQNAIRANPQIAAALVAQLIAAFPTQAAEFTKIVVDTVVALPAVTQEAKSQLLTQVAQSAVNAALAIPQGRVDSILQTVNAVKQELAQVPEVFQLAVQQYIVPLTPESSLLTGTNDNEQNTDQDDEIISPDTL